MNGYKLEGVALTVKDMGDQKHFLMATLLHVIIDCKNRNADSNVMVKVKCVTTGGY